MNSVNVIVSGVGYTSPTAHFEVVNGTYYGSIHVIALSPGTYTVTAFVSDATSAERTFTVSDRIAATSAVMDENAMTITGNESKTLSVSLLPETTTDVIADIQWSSSYNGAYVSVNNGVVSINAVSKNVQTVTATVTTDAGETFICTCDVTTAYGTMEMSPSEISLYPGDTGEFVLTLPSGFTESSWISGNADVASVEGSGNKATVTAIDVGQTDITVLVGNKFKATASVDIIEKPITVDTYTFTLKMDYDADIANYGESGYSASDLRNGIILTATGTNAGEALESALNQAKIPCKFWTKPDNTIRYWVDGIFSLGDIKLDGGLWKYWIQYQVINGEKSYNQWSLGFYTDGGDFVLLYGVTDESEHPVRPDEPVIEPEIPEQFDNSSSQTTVEVRENEDGSTTVIADSTSVIDGTQTVAEITTKENEDGSTTITENTTVTNPDGTSSTTNSVTTVAADGTKTTESIVTNPDGTSSTTSSVTTVAADGTKTTQSTVTNSDGSTSTISSTVSADGTTTTATETSKDASGNIMQTVETTTSVTDTTVNGVRTTETVKESTVTDASGNTTVVNVTETAVKQADGSSTVVRTTETVKDGKTVTETAVGSISADGRVHTTVTSADGEIVTSIRADGEDGSYSVSDASVQTALQQQSAILDAVSEDKEKVIEITSDTRDVSASIGQQALESMADDGASLRMVSVQGSMTFGKDAIANLSGKDDVTLSFAIADRSSMTSAQREVIEAGSTVVSLTATSGGQSIGKDLGGKVTVTVKHAAVDGKTPVAYYVDGDGNRTRVAEQHYDAEKEEMTMVLDHFSIYSIVDESPAGEELPVAVLVMTAVIVLICLGILLPQVVGRKQ